MGEMFQQVSLLWPGRHWGQVGGQVESHKWFPTWGSALRRWGCNDEIMVGEGKNVSVWIDFSVSWSSYLSTVYTVTIIISIVLLGAIVASLCSKVMTLNSRRILLHRHDDRALTLKKSLNSTYFVLNVGLSWPEFVTRSIFYDTGNRVRAHKKRTKRPVKSLLP